MNSVRKNNARTNIMKSIQQGIELRKVNTKKQNFIQKQQTFVNNPVLARRVALGMNNNNNYNNGNWNN